jgi:DNA repair exonuclease SbcCD ATPase subunit
MRQTFLLILLVAGIPAATLGQATASDAQTLQALLTEVRELRRDLRASLARIQSVQILLSRLQTQQAVVTRASDRLNDSRSKAADAQNHQKDLRTNLKRLEDALSSEQNPEQQKEIRDRITLAKSELEESADVEPFQAAEAEADQQLRIEQEKLSALEAQLDDLTVDQGKPDEQRVPAAH